jgi:hypothetical protein
MAKKTPIFKKLLNSSHFNPLLDPNSPICQEYNEQQALFDAQPGMVKHFLEGQARKLSEAVRRNQVQTSFSLPDRVALRHPGEGLALRHPGEGLALRHPGEGLALEAGPHTRSVPVPATYRQQTMGGVIDRLTRSDMRWVLRQRLAELESSAEPAVSTSARLLQHTLAIYMVHSMLPSGRSVSYQGAEGEEIPTIPVADRQQPESAITQATDAIVEEGTGDDQRGELQVPFVPAARRFYLPQWVAFDDDGKLLVNTINEAEAHLASMQAFITLLHNAVAIAPYVVADSEYQQKRYGMLGQLVNQGRALAWYETQEMIATIKSRVAANDLNRGLSLSVPYFDDQDLELRTRDFEVIPAGRIMFVPAFVVRAVREEQAKTAQDTRLSPSTRKYLLKELKALEKAFEK